MYANLTDYVQLPFVGKTMGGYLQDQDYRTGFFGKMYNDMGDICDEPYAMPPGWDRYYGMCIEDYYNVTWNDQGVFYETYDKPEDYTTSLIGNTTLKWLNTVKDVPFFAYVSTKAPHLPSTPAAWYIDDVTSVPLTAPRTETYNFTAPDYHWLVAQQDIITDSQAAQIDNEYHNRLLTLKSVDDLVEGIYNFLKAESLLKNTYFIFNSDHGYSMGQFRIPSRKEQPYDHNLRVPAYFIGPGIQPASSMPALLTQADLLPTFMEIAGASSAELTSPDIDGKSFLTLLTATHPSSDKRHAPQRSLAEKLVESSKPIVQLKEDEKAEAWRTSMIAIYQSKQQTGNVGTAYGHLFDMPNNTFAVLRTINSTTDLAYIEYVYACDGWDFAEPYAYELFINDFYQQDNVYYETSAAIQQQLRDELHTLMICQGNDPSSKSSCP